MGFKLSVVCGTVCAVIAIIDDSPYGKWYAIAWMIMLAVAVVLYEWVNDSLLRLCRELREAREIDHANE